MIYRWIALASAALTLSPAAVRGIDSGSSSTPTANQNVIQLASAADIQAYKQMSLEQLMDQEVTSVSKKPEPLRQAPAAIRVVSNDEIHRSTASSIPEALRLADNLYVTQQSSSTWKISARGFNASVGNKLLVLMDGRTVYTPLFSGVIWNMQDYLLEDLDRIEVISGPGGTLWGANAVNGVINIISKDAKDTQGFYAEAGGGNWLEDFVGVRYGGTLATNVYYRIYGKYFDRGAEDYPDGSSAHDSWNRGQGGFRIDSHTSEQNHLMLEGSGFGGANDVQPGGEGNPKANGDQAGGHLLGRWNHFFSDESDMTLQLYYDRTHLEAPFPAFAGTVPAGTLTDDLDTYDLDFQHRFPLGERNRIVWGLGYRFTHDVVDEAPLVAFYPSTLDRNLYSGFLQDEIKLRDNLFFTLGSKLEHNDYTGFEYEPSARLQWNVTDSQMIWAAVSRAVRTPSRYDRDLYQPDPKYFDFLAGNASFDSENVIAYELGYRAVLNSQVSGALSTFYNDYDHLRSLNSRDGSGLPVIFENHLRAETYGLELTTDYQVLSGWRLHFGYDLLEENVSIDSGGDLANGKNETADPEHQFFVRSYMDLPYHLSLDADFRWIDRIRVNDGPNVATVPSYAELNLRLAWRATENLEFSVNGQNLLHDRHPETGYPNAAQEEIKRSIYGKVTWRF